MTLYDIIYIIILYEHISQLVDAMLFEMSARWSLRLSFAKVRIY